MAALTRVVAKTLAEAQAAVATHAAGGRLFVLFTGADGWCPDCEAAHPQIEAALARLAVPAALVEVPLPRAEYSLSASPANSAHWARASGLFKLQRIPTLMRINAAGTKKLAELIEGDAASAELLDELFGNA